MCPSCSCLQRECGPECNTVDPWIPCMDKWHSRKEGCPTCNGTNLDGEDGAEYCPDKYHWPGLEPETISRKEDSDAKA